MVIHVEVTSPSRSHVFQLAQLQRMTLGRFRCSHYGRSPNHRSHHPTADCYSLPRFSEVLCPRYNNKVFSDLYTVIICNNCLKSPSYYIGITWVFYSAIISCRYINVYREHMGAFWTSHPSNRQSEIEIFANRYIYIHIYNIIYIIHYRPPPPPQEKKQPTSFTTHLIFSFHLIKVTPIPFCHSWVGMCWVSWASSDLLYDLHPYLTWLDQYLPSAEILVRFFQVGIWGLKMFQSAGRWCVGFGTLLFWGAVWGWMGQRIILVHFPICYRFEAAEWSSFNKTKHSFCTLVIEGWLWW